MDVCLVSQVVQALENEKVYLMALALRPASGAKQKGIADFLSKDDKEDSVKGKTYGEDYGPFDDLYGYGLKSFSASAVRKLLNETGHTRMELQARASTVYEHSLVQLLLSLSVMVSRLHFCMLGLFQLPSG